MMTATASVFAYFLWYEPKYSKHPSGHSYASKHIDRNNAAFLRMKQKAISINDFAKANNYNDTYCFLVDMRIASGLKRFFIYNLEKDSIEAAGLVSHGSGSENKVGGLSFSNIPNSNATSVGRYRLGRAYNGKFGLSYKLFGLDETNNKAFDRFVVLHSHSCVPNDEVAPLPICESLGCPMVAPAFLNVLKKYIDNSARPMLLWIYY